MMHLLLFNCLELQNWIPLIPWWHYIEIEVGVICPFINGLQGGLDEALRTLESTHAGKSACQQDQGSLILWLIAVESCSSSGNKVTLETGNAIWTRNCRVLRDSTSAQRSVAGVGDELQHSKLIFREDYQKHLRDNEGENYWFLGLVA